MQSKNRARAPRRAAAILAGLTALGVGAVLIVQSQAQAQQQPNRTAQLIHYRKALYTVMSRDFGWLNNMARDRAPFDAAESAKRARRMEVVIGILPEAFPEDSQGEGSKAKPEIWTDKAGFDKLMQELQSRAAKLTQVAGGGQEADIKSAIKSLGEVCGQCHDKYKNK